MKGSCKFGQGKKFEFTEKFNSDISLTDMEKAIQLSLATHPSVVSTDLDTIIKLLIASVLLLSYFTNLT